jgi:RHS repeat-associated protein
LTTAGATTETYDAAGNRTNAGSVTGADNRLISDGTWNYSYDAVGNQAKKVNIATGETWTYGYDFNNRLTSAVDRQSDGGVLLHRVAFQYDVFGNRVEKDVTAGDGTSRTRFAYDGKNAWADLDGNNGNALQTRHLYLDGLDQPVARISAAGVVAWYLTDHLGSVRDVVNDNGVVLDHIDYTAFGNVTNETNPAKGDRFGWAGGVRDGETGLSFFDHRYYNPQTGEWTTKDPSGFRAGDANLYRYVGNDATNATDPTGLFNGDAATKTAIIAGSVGFVVGAYIWPPGGELVGGAAGAILGFVWGGISQDGQQTNDWQAIRDGTIIGLVVPVFIDLAAIYVVPAVKTAAVATWAYLTTKPEAANLGQSYGKLGTVVTDPRLTIMGCDPYGIGRMAERGLSPAAAQMIVRNASVVLSQSGGKYLFLSQEGAVVLDNRGFIVTAWSTADHGSEILQILRDAGKLP